METGELEFSFPKISARYHIASFTHDDKLLCAGDYSKVVHVYNVIERTQLFEI